MTTEAQVMVTQAMIDAAKRYVRGEDDAIGWAIEAALAENATRTNAPGECVVVPREPTEAMQRAGWRVVEPSEPEFWDVAGKVYAAMISAAPTVSPDHIASAGKMIATPFNAEGMREVLRQVGVKLMSIEDTVPVVKEAQRMILAALSAPTV